MPHSPRIPAEQRSYADKGDQSGEGTATAACGDPDPGMGRPGDAGGNPAEHGRFGDLKQNLTNAWKVQVR